MWCRRYCWRFGRSNTAKFVCARRRDHDPSHSCQRGARTMRGAERWCVTLMALGPEHLRNPAMHVVMLDSRMARTAPRYPQDQQAGIPTRMETKLEPKWTPDRV